MPKQFETNKFFVDAVTTAFQKREQYPTIAAFCMWMVKEGILPESYINKYLAVRIYAHEIERTKCKQKPRGVKWLAIHRTLERVPICEKTLRILLRAQKLPKSSE
jgi:hypothetical protein